MLQTVTVRYRSQAVCVYKQLHGPISIFLYPSFYSVYFPIELNGEMLIGQNKSHDYSATLRRRRVENRIVQSKRQMM